VVSLRLFFPSQLFREGGVALPSRTPKIDRIGSAA